MCKSLCVRCRFFHQGTEQKGRDVHVHVQDPNHVAVEWSYNAFQERLVCISVLASDNRKQHVVCYEVASLNVSQY